MKSMKIAALFLSTAFILAPCLSIAAYAHDGGQDDWHSEQSCRPQMKFTDAQMQLLHQMKENFHARNQQSIDNMHKLHEKMHEILMSPTFDKQAFLSTSAQIDKIHEHLKREKVEAFASIAEQFTPEQRMHLIMMFGHHHHGHYGMDHGWNHEGGWNHEHGDGTWHEWHHADDQNPDMNNAQPAPDQGSGDYPPQR